jgi:hypothetical protein
VLTAGGAAQTVTLRPAPQVDLPPVIDGNSAAFWARGQFHLMHSSGEPSVSRGINQYSLPIRRSVAFTSTVHRPVWFESVWRDRDGTLFLWYHHEPENVCSGNDLTAPKIGAAVSYDNGVTVYDLGIVLESGYPVNCSAENGFFAGGHGDFTVVPDRERRYFYFFFTNYSGPLAEQGVATARMAFDDRHSPVGAVWKYFNGGWDEPGLSGSVTPVFPAKRSWTGDDTDSFWGPSVHWNTRLQQFVVLLNRSCCSPGWPQDGIYVSFNADPSQPEKWLTPQRLLPKALIPWSPGYYPQVLGIYAGETDSLAGPVARLYVHGRSVWEILFDPRDPDPPFEAEPPSGGCPDPDSPCPATTPTH